MKVEVDRDLCALTGQCVIVAPEVFSFDEDDLIVVEHPDESNRDTVAQAVNLCPMQAISLQD